jgi:Tfp pilus assembly protein PilX
MKLAFTLFLFVILIFIGIRAYDFFSQERALSQNLSDIQTKLTAAQSQEADLQAETQYLSNPANLQKELRANFNYKKPGETMLIIIPAPTSTGQ